MDWQDSLKGLTYFHKKNEEDALSMLVLCNERPDLVPIALFNCDTVHRRQPIITFVSFPGELDNEFAWDPYNDFCLQVNSETTKTAPPVPPYGYQAERENDKDLEVAYRRWKKNGERMVEVYQYASEVFEYIPYNLDKLAMITASFMKQCGIIDVKSVQCGEIEIPKLAKLTV